MNLIALVIIGAAAGFLATRFMKLEANVLITVSIGILGALFGELVLRVLLTITGWLAGFVGAVLGAMALIWLWRKYRPKS